MVHPLLNSTLEEEIIDFDKQTEQLLSKKNEIKPKLEVNKKCTEIPPVAQIGGVNRPLHGDPRKTFYSPRIENTGDSW